MRLADRSKRLHAAIIDGFCMMVLMIPASFALGLFQKMSKEATSRQSEPYILTFDKPLLTFSDQMLAAGISIVIFLLLNGYLLAKYGQTLGKRKVGIKIVSYDGDICSLMPLYLRRYLLPTLLGHIPLFGGIFSLANILFIFSDENRCIHDVIADTIVVDVDDVDDDEWEIVFEKPLDRIDHEH